MSIRDVAAGSSLAAQRFPAARVMIELATGSTGWPLRFSRPQCSCRRESTGKFMLVKVCRMSGAFSSCKVFSGGPPDCAIELDYAFLFGLCPQFKSTRTHQTNNVRIAVWWAGLQIEAGNRTVRELSVSVFARS
ncbi:MAG: hypothetical protein ACI8P0_005691 [Planctomycetaceae bacterium]|jgi:hypothetical protein